MRKMGEWMKKVLHVLSCIIWILCGGIEMALLWYIIGLILCISIVGIPFGLECFKLARFSFLPVGKTVEWNYKKYPIANMIWAIIGGWVMALIYLLFGIANCITLIGIPTGIRCFRIMKLAIFPFGAKIKKCKSF